MALLFVVTNLALPIGLGTSAQVVGLVTYQVAYPAVLVRIPNLERLDRDELHDLVAEAWLTRAQKRVAKAWLAEQEPSP